MPASAGLGLGTPYQNQGAPTNGIDKIMTLTIGGTPTSGTFKIAPFGRDTAAITWSATNNTLVANILAALEAHPAVGSGNVTVAVGTMTAGIGTITITAATNLGRMVLATWAVSNNSLVGSSPTAVITQTTAGVDATARGAAAGALLLDTSADILYINRGPAVAPVWRPVGARRIQVTSDIASINANTTTDVSFTCSNLNGQPQIVSGERIVFEGADSLENGLIVQGCKATGDNAWTVRISNLTGSGIDAASRTWRFIAFFSP